MDTNRIIQAIDEEVFRLQQVISLLTGNTAPLKRGRGTSHASTAQYLESGKNLAPAKKRRKISAEERERMSAAQGARWAKATR